VLGQDIVAGLTRTPAVTRPLSLRITSLAEAQAEMDDGVAYAAIVVHPTFSASVLAVLGGPLPAGTPPQASVELLSNPRLGCDSKNPDGPASPSGAGRGSGSRPG